MTCETSVEAIRDLAVIARKHTFVLMVAVRQADAESARRAARYVRDALRVGRRCAMALGSNSDRSAALAMLDTISYSAAPWLNLTAHEEVQLRQLPAAVTSAQSRTREAIRDADINGATISELDLRGFDVERLRARESHLERLLATNTRLASCDLSASSLPRARFDAATIDRCSFDRANLERTSWIATRTNRSSFTGAMLIDARLDSAVFINCDFQGVDFGVVNGTLRDAPSRTTFIRCDVRVSNWSFFSVGGCYFFECKMFGVHGRPLHADSVEIVRPDLSPAGNRSMLGTDADVRRLWRVV